MDVNTDGFRDAISRGFEVVEGGAVESGSAAGGGSSTAPSKWVRMIDPADGKEKEIPLGEKKQAVAAGWKPAPVRGR